MHAARAPAEVRHGPFLSVSVLHPLRVELHPDYADRLVHMYRVPRLVRARSARRPEIVVVEVAVVEEADDAHPRARDAIRVPGPGLGAAFLLLGGLGLVLFVVIPGPVRRWRRRRSRRGEKGARAGAVEGLLVGEGSNAPAGALAEEVGVVAEVDHDSLKLLPVGTRGTVVEEGPPEVGRSVLAQVVDTGPGVGVGRHGLPAGGQDRDAVEDVKFGGELLVVASSRAGGAAVGCEVGGRGALGEQRGGAEERVDVGLLREGGFEEGEVV